MPEGQLIFDTVEKKSFFVVRTFSKGFLVWFAHEIDKGLWSYDMSAEKLEWRFALKLERYKAVPTKVCSPLSLRLQASSLAKEVHRQKTFYSLGLPRCISSLLALRNSDTSVPTLPCSTSFRAVAS